MNTELLASLEINLERPCQLYVESGVFPCASAAEKVGMLSYAVNDRYRCPEEFFNLVLDEQLSSDDGYFRFGPDIICYGRSCSGARRLRPESSLYDTITDVAVDDGKLSLPFDPTEIIDNLRLERYANTRDMKSSLEKFLRRLYYRLRPLTNLTVRKQIQKFHARSWKRQSFPKWPVDTTVEDICELLLLKSMEAKGVETVPFIWFWPDGASGCLMMTHDVETEAGKNHCADLMDVDDSFGIKASFQIVPQDRYAVSQEFVEMIRDRGFDIAIQDLNHDGQLFDNEEEFLRRIRTINQYAREYGAKGFRAAILYRKPEWYEAFEFAFDMSIPNVAHLDPQRGGCCTVMPYFIGNVLELPVTTIQDYTLFHLLDERSIDLWKAQVTLIFEKYGLASFIVHPDYILEPHASLVYKELLAYLQELCANSKIWSALPAEVDSWWRARSKMSVVKDGDSWRIEGDDTKRAVLAYAKIVNGEITYELERSPGIR
jgi:hypothetical protein